MPPRIRPSGRLNRISALRNGTPITQHRAASVAASQLQDHSHTVHRYAPTQPPSYKLPTLRKSQLHRQYQSLLKSTPLMLLFQHNNLTSPELNGIRRELATALRKVDDAEGTNYAEYIKLQVIQTGLFASALQVVEFWDPSTATLAEQSHGLSHEAHKAVTAAKRSKKTIRNELSQLMSGPIILLILPVMSPQHLKSCLQILSPNKEFPAPKRRVMPTYHEPAVQAGIQKLLLLGARAEGKVFDSEGARWIGGIDGGLTGLRAQLVAMLQQFGIGVASTLEAASKSLYFTVEGRRMQLDEEANSKKEEVK